MLTGAGGRGRTDTPFGNTILSRARLPIPPHRLCGHSYSVKSQRSQTKRRVPHLMAAGLVVRPTRRKIDPRIRLFKECLR